MRYGTEGVCIRNGRNQVTEEVLGRIGEKESGIKMSRKL
jgi:hypothetical protein